LLTQQTYGAVNNIVSKNSPLAQWVLDKNHMRFRGTAEQYTYILEEKIINGQKVIVKQYGCIAKDNVEPHAIIKSSNPYPQVEE